jgi:hypothetical protein
MKLIIGSSCISFSLLIFYLTLLASRNPKKFWWASENIVSNVYCILIIGMGFIGLVYLGSALWGFSTGAFDALHAIVAVAVFAGTLVTIKMMGIKRRLNEYDNKKKDISFQVPIDPGQINHGHSPDLPEKATLHHS